MEQGQKVEPLPALSPARRKFLPTSSLTRTGAILLGAVILHFLLFLLFVLSQQFFWLNGKPYIVLGDDAMVSMRYAWHWAHGAGPYWNGHPTPEGYTNFLWVVIMTLFHMMAGVAGISVNFVSGTVLFFNLILAVASILLLFQMTLELTDNPTTALVCAYALALNAQFLLWGKAGFETTLIVFLIVGANLFTLRGRLWSASLLLSCAVLTRDDAILLVICFTLAQVAGNKRKVWINMFSVAFVPLILFVSHVIFRIHYYGTALPNTYYLKATSLPLAFRLNQGILYEYGMVPAFALSAWILLRMLKTSSVALSDSRRRTVYSALLLLLPIYFLYVLWVGGDAFSGSRLFVFSWIVPCVALAIYLTQRAPSRRGIALAGGVFLVLSLSPLNRETASSYKYEVRCLRYALQSGLGARYAAPTAADVQANWQMPPNARNIWQCLNIRNDAKTRSLLQPSMAVYYAGVAPYFCEDFDAVDLLGKSDATIAREKPHLPGRVGHNKYDYEYSLKTFKPTYILSDVPNPESVDDIQYVRKKPGLFNFQHLVEDEEFKKYYHNGALAGTYPVIFIRDDAH